MSGNIKDTKINIIKENVDNLIIDLDNILDKGENISDYEYNLKKKYKFLENYEMYKN